MKAALAAEVCPASFDLTRMRKFASSVSIVMALLFAVAFASPLRAQDSSSPRAKALNDRIMCMCGGCSDAAGKCTHSGGAFAGPCAFAQKEMKEVSDRVASGQSDDLVLQSFVQEYGPTVLISPPAKGFNLWAWLMPIIVPLAGIALALFFIMRWRKRVAAAPAPRVSSDLLARAQHDMSTRLND
ncbi:MAG TPA: cytochrome c-type biogenesis protein CcmH [Candidatus Acidoferrales bacterium]|nr:cytochrome c-type biogenesis protein CcmH [Candidatus Acidoferrales bacterium]